MNLDKPQSRYLNFVNVDFLSPTSYRSFVYTGQYLFIRVYTSTNARRPNGCPPQPNAMRTTSRDSGVTAK